ncbi:hypothetical protein DFH28DRAFT_1056771 [Melampsora americana]|nr:hypothetical protein DFH28DRAFT_1056771 [Melampsora americana]
MTSPLLMTMFSDVQEIYTRLKTIARPNAPETMEYYVDALLSLSTEVIHPAKNDVKSRSPGGEHIDPLLLSDITPPTVIASKSEESQDDQVTVLDKSEAQGPDEVSEKNSSTIASPILISDNDKKMENLSFAIKIQVDEISDRLLQLNTNNLQKRKFTSIIPNLTDKKNSKPKIITSASNLIPCYQNFTSNPQDLTQDDSESRRVSLSPPSKLKLRLCIANQIKYGTKTPEDLDFKENLFYGPSLGVNDEIQSDLVEDKSS